MTPDQRQNTLTWLNGEIRGFYATIINESYPTLVGLPIDDDGDIASIALAEMSDEELDEVREL